eukprot:528506-Hanusia_phi.AAC.1
MNLTVPHPGPYRNGGPLLRHGPPWAVRLTRVSDSAARVSASQWSDNRTMWPHPASDGHANQR